MVDDGQATTAGPVWTFRSAPAPTRVIALSGNLAFGNVTVGSTAQATLTIANTGNSTLTVSSINYPAGFSGNWSSGTITADGAQPVTVTFAAASVTSYGNTLTVNADQTSGNNTYAISGTGIPAPAVVALNPSTLNQVYDGSSKVVTASTTPPGLALTMTYNSSATPPTGAGTYNIVAIVNDPNYTGSASGTLTVTLAPLTVTANNASRTYGGANPAFSATITGFVNGETVAVVSGVASLTTAATATSPVGPYPIVPAAGTLSAANYTFANFVNGTLAVNPAPLTITANNQSKTYGQAVAFAGTEFTTSGLQNSETVGSVTLTSSGAVATAGVSGSPFGIVPSAATGGTFNPANYTISYQNGALTVNPAALTVTANDTNRVYGLTNPAFTGTVVGLQNNDNITAIFTCSAGASSPVGIYAIVPSLVDPSGKAGNYSTTLSNGRLTITAPEPRITGGRLNQAFGVSVNSTAVGANYVLEFKNSLANPFWLPVQSLPGNGGMITFTNDTAGAPARFYRIRVE